MRSSNAIEPIKVLIVDDEAVVLSSLRKYFSMVDDIEVVAEATNGNAALATLKNMPVDVVLADIHMEGMDGIALLDHISSFPILLLLWHLPELIQTIICSESSPWEQPGT